MGDETLSPSAPGMSNAQRQQQDLTRYLQPGNSAVAEAMIHMQQRMVDLMYMSNLSFYAKAPSVLGEGVGKEPASEVGEIAALPYPTGKPHDFSNPYCTERERLEGKAVMYIDHRLCVHCGHRYDAKRCTPIPGWREDRERELVQVQNAQEAARALECQTPLFHPQSISAYVTDARLLRKAPW